MANNWKYATLTQRERLKRISGGDKDVYSSEMKRTNELKKDRTSLGLDTSDLDSWQNTISRAYAKTDTSRKTPDELKLKVMWVSPRITEMLDNLERQYKTDKQGAIDNANLAHSSLSEWLANNGLNENTAFAKQKKEDIDENLQNELSSLKENYSKKRSSILA